MCPESTPFFIWTLSLDFRSGSLRSLRSSKQEGPCCCRVNWLCFTCPPYQVQCLSPLSCPGSCVENDCVQLLSTCHICNPLVQVRTPIMPVLILFSVCTCLSSFVFVLCMLILFTLCRNTGQFCIDMLLRNHIFMPSSQFVSICIEAVQYFDPVFAGALLPT